MRTLLCCICAMLPAATAFGQFNDAPASDKGPQFTGEMKTRIKCGVIVKSSGLLFRGVATVPVPADWPEQQVEIVAEDVSPAVRSVTYRDLTGGGGQRQMVVQIPQLPAGQEARALVTFEVTRRSIQPPADTSIYTVPKRLSRDLRIDLGPSPYIESRHPKVMAAAREAAVEGSAWSQVEALYDWTREHVSYTQQGNIKGAARAIIDKEGYTDELTSVFVALCRASKIPARTVFVPGHCYAEFYLEDDEGQGHWFPCQPAGARAFGGLDDVRPVLQKGDNFKNPENAKERLRWVKEYFHASGRGGRPEVKFVNEPVPL